MQRYMFRLSYMGTSYRGSQKHTNQSILDVDSIQGALECSLYRLKPSLVRDPEVVFAGRTDCGVHALSTVAHVDLEHKSGYTDFDTNTLIKCMNRYFIGCGHDIRIHICQKVSDQFHARFSAVSRSYLYRFMTPKDPNDRKIPIAESGKSLFVNIDNFDIEKMKAGLKLFIGLKDFTTFSSRTKKGTIPVDYRERGEAFVRTVRQLDVRMEETQPLMTSDPLSKNFNYYNVIFTSKSFMYNQIRRIMGALIGLGSENLTEEDIITMLQVPSHKNWPNKAVPAMPHGLYLLHVEYNEAEFQNNNKIDSPEGNEANIQTNDEAYIKTKDKAHIQESRS